MSGDNTKASVAPDSPREKEPIRKETQRYPDQINQETLDVPVSKANEYVGAAESAEVAGEVSEIMQSKKEGYSGGSRSSSNKKAMTPAQIKAELLQKAPSEKAMKSQIKREINKEIRYLHRRARRIVTRPGSVNAFELNNIVKKIRDLKDIIISLAKAVLNTTRTFWLRFVHGVM
ncbi:hypothetical protein HOE67_01155 [Candidatus Peregrinibacteria bacterium]|jgi:hypothetical protein|nr:hypothetical protein [Candidatus Peregrinibacteria bacterium]MBT4055694.1 hypothetical protein [Candidatus Peregrinibacteria bacterium]